MTETTAYSPIGITMGCPVGVGPEIVVRFLAGAAAPAAVVVGDLHLLERCAAKWSPAAKVVPWKPGQDLLRGAINVLSVSCLDNLVWGQPNAETGRAMAQYIESAVQCVQASELSALVTCPITKAGLKLAGYSYPGHTEMLASLCKADDFGMMLTGDQLTVSLVTIHTALSEVPGQLQKSEVERVVRLTGRTLEGDFGISAPRIAVAGLNPHAGESGMFGQEEEQIIGPAVETVAAEGMQVTGPLPPDTVFFRAARGEFDGVVCMYHDQGLIPFKLLHFADGVNVTMGLPIIRTSVDHGTAYDIAGTGQADSSSLAAACRLAIRMVENRRKLEQRRDQCPAAITT